MSYTGGTSAFQYLIELLHLLLFLDTKHPNGLVFSACYESERRWALIGLK
jgi:hypothetical protein